VTIIYIDHTLPGGSIEPYGEVQVKLLTGGSYGGAIGGTVISGTLKTALDADGYLELDLEPNEDMEVLGTVWRVKVVGDTWYISVPNSGGPYSLGDASIQAHPVPQTQLVPGLAATVEIGDVTQTAPGGPPTVTNSGTATAAVLNFGIPPSVDADAYGIDVTGGLASYDYVTGALATGIIVTPTGGDDTATLQAGIDQATATGATLVPFGDFTHSSTLTWDTDDGPLTVDASRCTITYTGTSYAWDLNMDSGAAGLDSVHFTDGTYIGNASADGCFYMHDVRTSVWEHVEVRDFTAGKAWHVENEGKWSERNAWYSCGSRDNRQAIHLDCYTTNVTHKATSSSVATLTVGTHRWIVGDRVVVELDTPDADYDGTNQTLTAVTATTISFATAGANEATTAATGVVRSKGSFARTIVKDMELSGGTADYAHIEMHANAGPYDSLFDGFRGNIAEDSIVMWLAGGTMGGTTIGHPAVERQSTGQVYYFKFHATQTGQRPQLITDPRITADGEFDLEGVVLYHGTPPDESPWRSQTVYGGIDTDAYIEAVQGLILRISSTHPVLGDWPTNPPEGTLLLRDGSNGSSLVTELAVRTSAGFRTSGLRNRRETSGTAAPTDGDWTRGDICHNTAPSVGAPSFWQCVTTGTPGTWAASPNLV
jgi:hypothetical protein